MNSPTAPPKTSAAWTATCKSALAFELTSWPWTPRAARISGTLTGAGDLRKSRPGRVEDHLQHRRYKPDCLDRRHRAPWTGVQKTVTRLPDCRARRSRYVCAGGFCQSGQAACAVVRLGVQKCGEMALHHIWPCWDLDKLNQLPTFWPMPRDGRRCPMDPRSPMISVYSCPATRSGAALGDGELVARWSQTGSAGHSFG